MTDLSEQDTVDWEIPVAKNVPTAKLDLHKLAHANQDHGVEIDTHGDQVDIYKKVVESLPAPRRNIFWRRLFGLD